MNKSDNAKLALWKERLGRENAAYSREAAQMDRRDSVYRGDDGLRPIVQGDYLTKAVHVRNIASELIESQISSAIPQPKVTARRKEDEPQAETVEDMLRNELDRMPFEEFNDSQERTVPIQGGSLYLIEWDNTLRTHTTVGEVSVSVLHPKQVVPQDGIYTGIRDMDYIILKIPQTKEYIRQRYHVDLRDESESEPEIKSADAGGASEDLVTRYAAYYRNKSGGIGLFSWVNDTVLEDLEDYQARRLKKCTSCGKPEAAEGRNEQDVGRGFPDAPVMDRFGYGGASGMPRPTNDEVFAPPPSGERCPYCGGVYEEADEEYETVYVPIARSDGSVIPAGTRIPYYKPNVYPVILQKNVTVFGQFLGESDIDKIIDQQNTTNRIETKIIDKLLKAGSYITLPDEARIAADAEDMKVIRPGSAANASLIGVYDLQGEIGPDLQYLGQVYEEARQIIGITDSFQGRQDRTATSGVAKQFAASQSAGRLESKRVMKYAAYADIFETIFKFRLAYADEPRPVVAQDIHGNSVYTQFNRYDFLREDEAGEWYWNDQFLFSCDSTAPLASNREAMWQETRLNLQTGAFGDPTQTGTLILFWSKMEMLHYPGAGETKTFLEEEMRAAEAANAEMRMQNAEMGPPGGPPPGGPGDEQMIRQVMEQARAAAERDARGGRPNAEMRMQNAEMGPPGIM